MKYLQGKKILIAILIVIAIFACAFGYIILMEKSALVEQQESGVIKNSQNTQPTDWQTLKSNDLGIEIKFPNYYRSSAVNSKLVAASELTIYPVPQPIEFGPRLVVSRNSSHITADTSIETWVDNIFSNDKNISLRERGNATINGTSWIKVKYLDVSGAGPEVVYVDYFAIKNGYMYTISYNETSQVNTDNFEKMIGTIAFL